MSINRLLIAAAAVSLIAGSAFAQAPAAPAAAAPAQKLVANGDITTTLRTSGQFTTLVKALDATNLASLLQRPGQMTLFAPTDAAFAALPPGKVDQMLADKAALQKQLLHLIINAPFPDSKIKGVRGPVPTGAGDQVVLDGSGDPLKADNANIIQAEVTVSNGIIHVVDQMLVAGSVPATLPEPPPAAAEAAPPPAPAAAPAKAPAKKKK